MSRILAFVLCIALLAQHLARFSVAGVYELRKDFVAKVLCENRARPELNCCGKCVLRKELAAADERAGDPKHASGKTEQFEAAVLHASPEIPLNDATNAFVLKAFNPVSQHMFHFEPQSRIFRPPLI